jgi:hypothetical protein
MQDRSDSLFTRRLSSILKTDSTIQLILFLHRIDQERAKMIAAKSILVVILVLGAGKNRKLTSFYTY